MKHYIVLGGLGAVIAYPFIGVSIMLSPWFNPYENALSDLGNIALNGLTAYIFNLGLILSGFLIALFALFVSLKYYSWRYLCWTILLLAAGIDLTLIGFFPEDTGVIHGLVSVIFFILIILVMLIYGCCSWRTNLPLTSIIAIIFGLVSVMVWIMKWPWRGVAIQEAVTSIMTSIWLLMVLTRKL
ncbi:MAG: DUF998 domain-containing protein [Candidatus Methanomethylicia archaeon]